MPRKPAPGTPEEWMVRAGSNLALARRAKPEEALWEDQCFQAHQAIEKALKAVYQKRGLLFRYVHDIDVLGKGLEQGGVRIPPEVRQAIGLTRYAHQARYPVPHEAATRKNYEEALSLATAVVVWADRIIRTPDEPGGQLVHEPPAVYKACPERRPLAAGRRARKVAGRKKR